MSIKKIYDQTASVPLPLEPSAITSGSSAARFGAEPRFKAKPRVASGYFGWFDSLRAILALAVFVSHAKILPQGHAIEGIGGNAVQVFFALSGFLVGGILLNRAQDGGNFWGGVPRFYFNRCIRIWTPYYLLILTYLALVTARGLWSDELAHRLVPALTYTHNWANFYEGLSPALAPINHMWSLGVEEQFYLLCPLVAGLVRDRRLVIGLMLVLAIFVPLYLNVHFYTCIALGVAAAAAYQLLPATVWRRVQLVSMFAGIPAFCAMVFYGYDDQSWLMAVAATSVVLGCSSNSPGTKLTYLLGAMSYSFYLFHWLGLYLANPVAKRLPDAIATPAFVILALGFSVVVSYLSVKLVETPLMQRRDAIAQRSPWLLSASTIVAITSFVFGLGWIWAM